MGKLISALNMENRCHAAMLLIKLKSTYHFFQLDENCKISSAVFLSAVKQYSCVFLVKTALLVQGILIVLFWSSIGVTLCGPLDYIENYLGAVAELSSPPIRTDFFICNIKGFMDNLKVLMQLKCFGKNKKLNLKTVNKKMRALLGS